jgi:hypothetical protein
LSLAEEFKIENVLPAIVVKVVHRQPDLPEVIAGFSELL